MVAHAHAVRESAAEEVDGHGRADARRDRVAAPREVFGHCARDERGLPATTILFSGTTVRFKSPIRTSESSNDSRGLRRLSSTRLIVQSLERLVSTTLKNPTEFSRKLSLDVER